MNCQLGSVIPQECFRDGSWAWTLSVGLHSWTGRSLTVQRFLLLVTIHSGRADFFGFCLEIKEPDSVASHSVVYA